MDLLLRQYAPTSLDEDAIAYLDSIVLSEANDENIGEDDLVDLIQRIADDLSDDNARALARTILHQSERSQSKVQQTSKSTGTLNNSSLNTRPLVATQKMKSNMDEAIIQPALTSTDSEKTPSYIDRSKEASAKREAREKKKAERKVRRKNKMRKNNKVHSIDNAAVKEETPTSPSDSQFAASSLQVSSANEILADSTRDMEEMDDHGSAWAATQAKGDEWGGRGRGGRGVGSRANTSSNIHLTGVTMSYSGGSELLEDATIQINGGHRYGLIGRNGVGKTSLLRRFAQKAIPGSPKDTRVLLVKQEVEGTEKSSLQTLLGADNQLVSLLREQSRLEKDIDSAINIESESETLARAVERLELVSSDLEAIDADGAEERARGLLKGLQFTEDMIAGPTNHLSGGWRMRLGIAQALFVPSDLLLLDEPSNHLDYYALVWLADYLSTSDRTLIIVSHDRSFLDDVCTDIMHFEHQKLSYHVGNYSAFQQQQDEKHARQAQILDASERKRTKAISFVEQQQKGLGKKKYQDPKKQRQAKMVREKKLDRIGNYREDGKRYKTMSLKKLSEDYLRTPEKVLIEADEPVPRLKFINPSWPPGLPSGSPLIQMESFSFSYSRDVPMLLKDLTLNINRGSKVALVGKNGEGKSTLLNLFTRKIPPEDKSRLFKGNLWTHPCLRVGHISQHSVEELDRFAHMTVVEYADQELMSGSACSSISSNSSGSKNVRQYLGAFGLGGPHSKRRVGNLSGGERMRLCLATVMAESPHLLCLDEPSNHLDMETLDVLAAALDSFEGSVVVISHNQSFLCGFCKELWVVANGRVEVRDGEFSDMFNSYKSDAISGALNRTSARSAKAKMARKAMQQRQGARKEKSGFVG